MVRIKFRGITLINCESERKMKNEMFEEQENQQEIGTIFTESGKPVPGSIKVRVDKQKLCEIQLR